MKILLACEESSRVRDEFIKRGHDARSCDFKPARSNLGIHYQCNVLDILYLEHWDAMIAFPTCTYLCSSGLHHNKNNTDRQAKTEEALEFVRNLLDAPIEKIGLENPVGCISTRIRKPDQYIQPYQFGDDASKKTCLWLKNLPLLKPTCYVGPRMVNGKPRWANQTDSGQNRLPPSADRGQIRSLTYMGIAKAMAEQWG